jgi:hypothetical protein
MLKIYSMRTLTYLLDHGLGSFGAEIIDNNFGPSSGKEVRVAKESALYRFPEMLRPHVRPRPLPAPVITITRSLNSSLLLTDNMFTGGKRRGIATYL